PRPPVRAAGCGTWPPRRRDDRALSAAARRPRAGGNAVVRAAEADRHRDGVHGDAKARAPRRAVRRRQSEPRRRAARAAGRAQPDTGGKLRRHRAQHGLRDEALPTCDLHGRGQGARRGPARRSAGEPAGARGISRELEDALPMTDKIIEFDKVVAGYSPSLTILNETTLD